MTAWTPEVGVDQQYSFTRGGNGHRQIGGQGGFAIAGVWAGDLNNLVTPAAGAEVDCRAYGPIGFRNATSGSMDCVDFV